MELLLRAAEYLDRKEREKEKEKERENTELEDHGYASSSPKRFTRSSKVKLSRSRTSFPSERNLHNELEKSRRANLRYSLEKLKDVIPSERGSSKFTTLQLLVAAKFHIEKLEMEHDCYKSEKNELENHLKELQKRLKKLNIVSGLVGDHSYRVYQAGSLPSDNDDIDVVECGGSEASSDDCSSMSNSSDGGDSMDYSSNGDQDTWQTSKKGQGGVPYLHL